MAPGQQKMMLIKSRSQCPQIISSIPFKLNGCRLRADHPDVLRDPEK